MTRQSSHPAAGDAPAHRTPAEPHDAPPQQYTIFFVDGETFAVSLDEVKEIIRMPDVVRLPLAPASLEGLANLRGTVLPIVNTRQLFGRDPVGHDDSTRVVILDHGQPIGIVVDRVASVVTIEADRIEPARAMDATVGADLLRGMIKDQGELGLVMILETRRLIEQDFRALCRAGAAGADDRRRDEGPVAGAPPAERAVAAERDELQLVSFEVAGQEYALPIGSVREIVQLPDRIARVPRTASSVVGVISLRERLLPVVSLRGLFGLEQGEAADYNRVAVVSVDGGEMTVGVVLDRVNEVLRVERGEIEPMPGMLAEDATLAEITAICRLDQGRRLVSILSAEAMFNRETIERELAEAGEDASIMAQDQRVQTAGKARGEEQFVVFRLMDEEYGVAIETVQEIVRVPDDVATVPNTEGFIRGVMNLRGSVIPLVDQRMRFGLPASEPHDRQRIVVFTLGGVQTGFIVDSVSEVMRIALDRINPAPDMSEGQRRLIRRVANLPEHKRMILLLDADRMLDAREIEEVERIAA